jgi:hypothetical protein
MNLNFNDEEPIINWHDDQVMDMLENLSDYFDFDDDILYYYRNVPLDILREFSVKDVDIRFLPELELIISDMMLKLNRNPFTEITCGVEIDLESRQVSLTGINFGLVLTALGADMGPIVTMLYRTYKKYLKIEDSTFSRGDLAMYFIIDSTPR